MVVPNYYGDTLDIIPIAPTGIEEKNLENGGMEFSVFPNPFKGQTTVSFELEQSSDMKIEIVDSIGRSVKTLLSEHVQAGRHKVRWDTGSSASGVYFRVVHSGRKTETKKILLIK